MAAEELKFSAEVEAELHPRVIILANDQSRYSAFAQLLEKNNYPCTLQAGALEQVPPPGTVVFISFNLKATDAVAVTKLLEQKHKLLCIVFAEEEGTKTATKLSSARMTQTLQYPYTEKNFVMAMQTIVKNRRAQAEKDLRKRQHAERMKARQVNKADDSPEREARLKFSQEAPTLEDAGLIVQRAAPKIIDDDAKVFKGDGPLNFFVLQGVNRSKSFVILQEGEPPRRWVNRENLPPAPKKRLDLVEAPTPPAKSTPESLAFQIVRPSPEQSEAVIEPSSRPSFGERISKISEEGIQSPSVKWAIVVMCLFGSLICLYCVKQIIFS